MNRPFLRRLAVKMGYGVHERSSHGPGKAWDWGPKNPMQGSHFRTEAEAWRALEDYIKRRADEADKWFAAVTELMREVVRE